MAITVSLSLHCTGQYSHYSIINFKCSIGTISYSNVKQQTCQIRAYKIQCTCTAVTDSVHVSPTALQPSNVSGLSYTSTRYMHMYVYSCMYNVHPSCIYYYVHVQSITLPLVGTIMYKISFFCTHEICVAFFYVFFSHKPNFWQLRLSSANIRGIQNVHVGPTCRP